MTGCSNGVRDRKARESVIVDFSPIEGSKAGELAARFDVVLGYTPPAEDGKGTKKFYLTGPAVHLERRW